LYFSKPAITPTTSLSSRLKTSSSFNLLLKGLKTISKLLDNRKLIVKNGTNIDWSTAETLAFGSLLEEGYPVRLVGQDSGRGTFSQRHSVLRNQLDNSRYIPLNNISKKQNLLIKENFSETKMINRYNDLFNKILKII